MSISWRYGVAAFGLVAATSYALAQMGLGSVQDHHHAHSPYAGFQQRGIKALSEQQLSDLRAGRGMGLALAAELNGYPGPLHVLELEDQIGLSTDQKLRVQQLYQAMKADAIAAGAKLIERETALDSTFASREITPEKLSSLTTEIGVAQGELRAVHLKYHLAVSGLLSTEQRQKYAELRGYH